MPTFAKKTPKSWNDDVKKPNLINKSTNVAEILENKIRAAQDALDVSLNVDDPDLIDQITLGEKWDDPFALTKAMATKPMNYAHWATLLRKLKREKQILQSSFDVWVSCIKNDLADDIFQENINSGMTASQSKPTGNTIDNRFNYDYIKVPNTENYNEYMEYYRPLQQIDEKIDIVEIVVKAFEQRKDMLISLSSLVRGMVDNQLLIYRKTHK